MTDIKLSNAQQRVLEAAADSAESTVEQLTEDLPAGARKSVIGALVKKGCIEKRGNAHFITAAGCNAVGRDATPCSNNATQGNAPKRETKQSAIMELLSREEGATVVELMEATGWKSHSVRGHISNMKRKGKANVEIFTRSSGERCYRFFLEEEAAA